MSVQKRLRSVEDKLVLSGLEGQTLIAYTKGDNQKLLNRDGTIFKRPSWFKDNSNNLIVLDWSLKI